ncbi:hydrogenase nickel incorporation protein HypB [Ammoniphilus sp. YIM 78166]|uniref:hydrogenase nickel incorporation protein HypB n=1 Tax=Ammoniphilus sp. YIM 78166 TaxID=1644106 RepID=UPI001F0E3BF4|nr:hydrogenase nickel incorporation protein HypB [Ammoniphilus sp. YIM 78166]
MKRVMLNKDVLHGNQVQANHNRMLFVQHSLLTINVMSSPGSGKTTFLERTIQCLKAQWRMAVIEGDLATSLDAERIASCGVEVIQINTHGACHLTSSMISSVLPTFDLSELDLVVIENVGNLVCPADFDLGEHLRVTLLSTPEGTDKIVKYPSVFQSSDAVILNKVDLLPYVPFDLKQFHQSLKEINPNVATFLVSALKGEGMDQWIHWLQNQQAKIKKANGRELT